MKLALPPDISIVLAAAYASFLVKLPCRVEPEKTRIEGVSVMFVSIPQNDFIGIKSNRRRLIRR
jgi:hypothetical protein